MNTITIISGYYYPEDTAIGLYNKQMTDYLTYKGYKVNVVTGFPSYPQWEIREDYKDKKSFLVENHNDVKIYRYKQYVPSKPTFLKRIVLLLDFTIGSFFNVLKIRKCDVVISIVPHTSTMILGWILSRRRKAKLWNHIQDFEFDAAKETGIYSKGSIIKNTFFSFLFWIERKLLNKGAINSTISYSMLDKLNHKSNSNSFYFPNWIDADIINPGASKTHKYLNSSVFKILYSGNIGDKQDWEFFLTFVNSLKDHNVEIVVVGDGARRKWLCEKIKGLKKVNYYAPVNYDELSDLLCSANLHILFQKNDVVDSVMPSKLLGMMASSKPSLITGNTDSEVKKVMDESKGGFYVTNGDLKRSIAIVEDLIESPDLAIEIGMRARNYIVNKFSKDKVLSSFEDKLSQLIKN